MKHYHDLTAFILILCVLVPVQPDAIAYAQILTRFAAIGDYGLSGQAEAGVAALVTSWNPEVIITLGDNNYENGAESTIDIHIGQYYHEYFSPSTGAFGSGDTVNKANESGCLILTSNTTMTASHTKSPKKNQ